MGSANDTAALRNACEKAQAELDAILDEITHDHHSRLIEISVSVELHRVYLHFGFTSKEIEVEISTDPDDPVNWREDDPSEAFV